MVNTRRHSSRWRRSNRHRTRSWRVRSKNCVSPFVRLKNGGGSRRYRAPAAHHGAAGGRPGGAEGATGSTRRRRRSSRFAKSMPTAPELPDLTERLQRAQAAARLNEEVERTLGDFDEQLTQGDLPRAGGRLEGGRRPRTDRLAGALCPPASRAGHGRARRQRGRRSAPARRRATDRRGRRASRRRAISPAPRPMLKLAAELVPQHPRAAELSEQLQEALARQAAAEAAERLRRQVEELIRSASQRLRRRRRHRRRPGGGVARSQSGAGARPRERRRAGAQDRD